LRPRTAPFTSCHTFSVAVSLCQFHRQSFLTASHHPIRILFFYQIFLDNHCILLYNIGRFYEKLFSKKRIFFMNEKEIMTVKQVSEYLQMDEHTVYKTCPQRSYPFPKNRWSVAVLN